jgi:NADH-ubiquinone oxidoreductase chain 6
VGIYLAVSCKACNFFKNFLMMYIVSLDQVNGLYLFALDILAFSSIGFAVLIITSKNPIVSVLYLISLFLTISVYLIAIGMHFIGLAYLLVYIGAISMLFLFTVMLINVRESELTNYTVNSAPLALIFSVVLFNILYGTDYLDSFYTYLDNFLDNDTISKSGIDFTSTQK